jgi:pilus assembly protein CpaB
LVAASTALVVGHDLAALHNRAKSLGSDVRVLLAARDLPLGTTIAENDLRIVTRPSAMVAADAQHDASAIVGAVVAIPVLRDDVVRARHLARGGGSGVDRVVPAGRRAIHVVSKDGYQPPTGSVVEVLATFDPAERESTDAHAESVAQGALVVALDADAVESGGTLAAGVTLLVTETEARAVAYAQAIGQVTLALAPPETACCSSTP